jgi:hypothetical protein
MTQIVIDFSGFNDALTAFLNALFGALASFFADLSSLFGSFFLSVG